MSQLKRVLYHPAKTDFAFRRLMRQILFSNEFDKEFFEMRSLNLDQLRTLVEVVALGNFSAAGRRLNLTQPAVSLHVRELEQRFGVRLVERVGKQAHPTAPGRDLVEHAERVLRACEDIDASMRRFREGWLGRVHIGTTLTALTYELPPILRKIRMEYPGIDLLVTNMPTRDSVQNVVQNAIDIALVTLPVKEPRLRVTPLRPETLVAILPAGTNDVPDVITPAYAAQQLLVMEHGRGAVHALVMRWLAGHMPLVKRPMLIGTVEAMKTVVSLVWACRSFPMSPSPSRPQISLSGRCSRRCRARLG